MPAPLPETLDQLQDGTAFYRVPHSGSPPTLPPPSPVTEPAAVVVEVADVADVALKGFSTARRFRSLHEPVLFCFLFPFCTAGLFEDSCST